MTRHATLVALLLLASGAGGPAKADGPGIVWSVYNPFRFYKSDRQFERHRAQFARLAAEAGATPPAFVQATENALNARNCADPSTPDRCRATWSGRNFETDRLGWAHDSVGEGETCYLGFAQAQGKPFRYARACRRASGPHESRDEDYVKPAVHAIEARLAPPLAAAHAGECAWTLTPASGAAETERAPCAQSVFIHDVPYHPGEAGDGGVLVVRDAGGQELARETVVVKDTLILGLGDSFGSGEGNPDVPIRFAAPPTNITYGDSFDPSRPALGGWPLRWTASGVAAPAPNDGFASQADAEAYYAARAGWTSPDCHRSQYSHQFRAALELALEDPHRAVTLIHLACSGADALEGVFGPMKARELLTAPDGAVPSQLQAALNLLCDEPLTIEKDYVLPKPKTWGEKTIVSSDAVALKRCAHLKRAPDLVFLSLGGNDVGFAPMVASGILKSAGDAAPVAQISEWLGGGKFMFAPVRAYLTMVRERLQIAAGAIETLLDVDAAQVVQTDYENLAVDENGRRCSGTAGLDGVSRFRFQPQALQKVVDYVLGVPSHHHQIGFFDVLRCTTRPDWTCGPGWDNPTRFQFVDTQKPFAGRGVCAFADSAERTEGRMPRADAAGDGFVPTSPADFLPYAPRRRLFVTMNDSYLKANTQIDCPFGFSCASGLTVLPPIADRLQLVMASLYGGAFHRTAEGHAAVADAMMNQFLRAWLKTH